MENSVQGMLVGSEIHGFRTLQDLEVDNIREEARTRWLRPNEIHAMLCNYKYFSIHVKPVNLPKSGTIVLFDRKMLRNFRKDGHNWKKKKDGKTVKEAHEHLKVGNEERIHVYYAHGEDNPTFVRRCYWLLDKTLEHVVLVHYRETQESQGSPATPVNSHSSSASDPSAPWILSEELDSGANQAYYSAEKEHAEPGNTLTVRNHEMRLHEINTLEWDELVADDPNKSSASKEDRILGFEPPNAAESVNINNGILSPEVYPLGKLNEAASAMGIEANSNPSDYIPVSSPGFFENDGLQSQDSFGRWMNYIMAETPDIANDAALESSISSCYFGPSSVAMNDQRSSPEIIFSITDVAPAWAFSTEKTKILITGFFHEGYLQHSKSNLLCICGDLFVPAELVQVGVYRCLVSPHTPGFVNLYMSFDGHKPISQAIHFEYRTPLHDPVPSNEDKSEWERLQLQMRLAFLLFSTSKCLEIASSKASPTVQKEAKKFIQKTSNISKDWAYLLSSVEDDKMPLPQAKSTLFELMLKNRLKDWISERVIAGGKLTEYDMHGQGVIHLCAILEYTWAINLFALSRLSLDFRDRFGWTALHWAAHCGSEKMVAKLLSAGAKPNLVTDPTSENPAGCTAADLATNKGYDGLAAFLAEKGLVQHFEDMSIAGNISGSLHSSSNDTVNTENLCEEELYLKDTLAAYRTAAGAAARIQTAFREHSLKVRTKQVEFSNPEDEARDIVAALKIQHAFRNFESRKRMTAAARIQYRFRTWKTRRDFLNTRRQVIKIQAVFRGYQVRRQYRKILWSVGVLEKAILRWRWKRRGFRGLHVEPAEANVDQRQASDTEEDFFRTSRRQAEERLEQSVVKVQAMFRSRKAQEDYRRMKLAHNAAQLEFQELLDDDDVDMER
ncbi:calmodulin-binding transcription activator 5 isoform X2 [Rhodamnia argentea]|uniref:Calmodulin-binding transcription activator 5 isoform X2 n=1 Tax=Rhodamnia argentea TaxID=178133 RepID=A0ABM3GY44_9MYRT|nr:calmodulin-binding transcription activator 5 isoform X2 [Rhodamnia argentea]